MGVTLTHFSWNFNDDFRNTSGRKEKRMLWITRMHKPYSIKEHLASLNYTLLDEYIGLSKLLSFSMIFAFILLGEVDPDEPWYNTERSCDGRYYKTMNKVS